MGFWLYRTHIDRRAFASDAQTETFDLPKKGILSNLLIRLEAKPGSQNNDIYLADIISKLEIIGNGSTVIQSMDGRQIQASMAFDDKAFPPDEEDVPGWAFGHFDIRFGRFPGDELYALDAGKWDSLELKFTYDLVAGGTIDTTGFGTGSGYLTALGLYSPDGVGLAPIGYLKKAEKRTFTASVGGTHDIDLPDDYPYRRLMLFTETHGNGTDGAFYRTTINTNDGARKSFDRIRPRDLRALAAMLGYGNYRYSKRIYLVQGAVTQIHRPLGWMTGIAMVPYAGGEWATSCPTQQDPSQIQWPSVTGVKYVMLTIFGLMPWGAHVIDLERMSGGKHGSEAMEAILGASEKDNIDLEIEENDTSACSIVLEQYASK